MKPKVDTSDEACAVVCMLVSNPQGALRKDGDGWQKRVNDVIRALRDERNEMRDVLRKCRDRIRAQTGVGFSPKTLRAKTRSTNSLSCCPISKTFSAPRHSDLTMTLKG